MPWLGILMCLVLSPDFVQGQTDETFNSSGAARLVFATNAAEARELAQADTTRGIPFLLLQNGATPVVYSTDSTFENRFRVYYHDYGCAGPDASILVAYNEVIFTYLDRAYGKHWRKSARKEVFSLRRRRK